MAPGDILSTPTSHITTPSTPSSAIGAPSADSPVDSSVDAVQSAPDCEVTGRPVALSPSDPPPFGSKLGSLVEDHIENASSTQGHSKGTKTDLDLLTHVDQSVPELKHGGVTSHVPEEDNPPPDVPVVKETDPSVPSKEDIPTFDEWKKKVMEVEKEKSQSLHTTSSGSSHTVKKVQKNFNNYASVECGAKILSANAEAKSTSAILMENMDLYMLNPCSTKIWFVIELCEPIQVKQLDIANFELFSSTPKDFLVSISDRYPTNKWIKLGTFHARDERTVQSFPLDEQLYAKYVKLFIVGHFCPLSLIRVFGTSMVEEYEEIAEPQYASERLEYLDEDYGKSTKSTVCLLFVLTCLKMLLLSHCTFFPSQLDTLGLSPSAKEEEVMAVTESPAPALPEESRIVTLVLEDEEEPSQSTVTLLEEEEEEESEEEYRKQMEEMQRAFNKTIIKLQNTSRIAEEQDQRQTESIQALQSQLENVTQLVLNLSLTVSQLQNEVSDRQSYLVVSLVLCLSLSLLLCIQCCRGSAAPPPNSNSSLPKSNHYPSPKRCFSSYDDMSLKRRVSCPLVRSKSFQFPPSEVGPDDLYIVEPLRFSPQKKKKRCKMKGDKVETLKPSVPGLLVANGGPKCNGTPPPPGEACPPPSKDPTSEGGSEGSCHSDEPLSSSQPAPMTRMEKKAFKRRRSRLNEQGRSTRELLPTLEDIMKGSKDMGIGTFGVTAVSGQV
uniref:SUN domain-containing ossification factor n=1 Tax=Scleropages formosus TaxID=113540 RepID=A0A8D0CET6_SCLFO